VKPVTKNGYGYYFPSTYNERLRTSVFAYSLRFQRKLNYRIGLPVLEFTSDTYVRNGIEDMGESCLAFLERLGLDDPRPRDG
jgi:hypothetical protein